MIVLVAASATACAAGPGAAALPRSGTSAFGTVATDGEQVVAWVADVGVVRVADERSETIATHRTPGRCADHLSELSVGGGQLALLCWDGARLRSRLLLLELATGRWRELPDPDDWRRRLGGGFELVDVGARWLRALTDAGSLLVDLRDGSRLPRPQTAAGTAATDLDAEQPYVPSCASTAQAPIAYEAPYALGSIDRWIALWRCGSPRPLLLDGYVSRPQLGSGIVSWEAALGDATARAYLPRCRLILAWTGFAFRGVAHTRTALYTTTLSRLRRVPLPRRCPRPAALRVRPAGGRAWTTVLAQLWPTRAPQRPLATRPPGSPATTPTVRRRGGPLELRLPHPATTVIWRVGTRRWTATMQGADRRRWSFPGPRRGGLTRVAIETRDGHAITQRYLLTIRR